MDLAIAESTTDAITLIVAIAGLTLAVVSLGWQAATFVLTGPRVKVNLQQGALGPGGAVVGPVDAGMSATELAQQGFTEPILAIEVVNVGRMPTTVTGWHAEFENGMKFTNPQYPLNPALPFRLEPQSKATWYVEARSVHATVSASHASGVTKAASQEVRMSVDLTNRKTIKTRQGILVSA